MKTPLPPLDDSVMVNGAIDLMEFDKRHSTSNVHNLTDEELKYWNDYPLPDEKYFMDAVKQEINKRKTKDTNND